MMSLYQHRMHCLRNSGAVPLNRLTNFYFHAKAEGSPLRPHVQHLVVATNESTQLPKRWQWTGATHRRYTAAEIDAFRARAREAAQLASAEGGPGRKLGADTARWPHQLQCLRSCLDFMHNASRRDFFVQMATGTGKSLVMADLLAELGQERACVIVPKLDLMEQMAQLLEETLHGRKVCRVGTGYEADLTADVFVCVRNSAWRLQNLTIDLLLLDEAHHYEPAAPFADESEPSEAQLATNEVAGVHATQVLRLNARNRIFFSATLVRNRPDFDFGLRPAVEAGVIQDYAVMVPVVSEGDPRPSLVELLQNLPFARKVLAFCNTVDEAKHFTRLLSDAGIAADHYNSHTSHARRQDVLNSFTASEARGGVRVLVTVDVLSEGVDLPVADTCLFVAPRRGVRLRQCVGRVLRKHSSKIDALVLAPPIVRREDNGQMAEPEPELTRLISELAAADASFHGSLDATDCRECCRVGVVAAGSSSGNHDEAEEAAKVLRVHVFPCVGRSCRGEDHFESGYEELLAFIAEYGHPTVPRHTRTGNNFPLGEWVWRQRRHRGAGKLIQGQIQRLDRLEFVWNVLDHKWQLGFEELVAYNQEHSNSQVPAGYETAGGFGLGRWVKTQRCAESAGKLSEERTRLLNSLDFVWGQRSMSFEQRWERGFEELVAFNQEHGNSQVPAGYKTAGGFGLGRWVKTQRYAESAGKLSEERTRRLNYLDFEWGKKSMLLEQRWKRAFEELVAYNQEHGNSQVPAGYKTADGFQLGRWVKTQRCAESAGKLSEEQTQRLKSLYFVWGQRSMSFEQRWERGFEELVAFNQEHGNSQVPAGYKTAGGFGLGRWVKTQRDAKSAGKLSEERTRRLNSLDFEWGQRSMSFEQRWKRAFEELVAYNQEHGNSQVPAGYKTADGFQLGRWVKTQRCAESAGKLSEEQTQRLNSLDFVWEQRSMSLEQRWERGFEELVAYNQEHGNSQVPARYKTAGGFGLGRWVKTQRDAKSAGKLSEERTRRLNSLDFEWGKKSMSLEQRWERGFEELVAYNQEHGNSQVPAGYETAGGFGLGRWVKTQRCAESAGKLSEERTRLLNSLDFVWGQRSMSFEQRWERGFEELVAFNQEHGNSQATRPLVALGLADG